MIISKYSKKIGFIVFCLAFALTMCGATAAAPTNSTHNSTIQLNTSHTTSVKTQKSPDPQIYFNGQPVAVPGYKAGYNFVTLAAAINAAQAGDTIMLENGATFTPTSGGFVISKNLNFNVFNNSIAYLTGVDTSTTGHIFTINSGVTVNINNIVFEDAQYSAIVNSGTLNLTNCNFTSNVGPNGGAILSVGTLIVNKCNFTNNAGNAYGGAIYSDQGILSVNNSTFTGNSASSNGGAIYNRQSSMTVNSSNFVSNIADIDGGAIVNYYSGTSTTPVTISKSTFKSNTATRYGGSILNNDGYLTVNSTTFQANSASDGGAILNGLDTANTGTLILTNSTFYSNSASYGGALVNLVEALNTTSITYVDNSATAYGGVIYNTGSAIVQFCRIVGNTAPSGSAIYQNGGTLNIMPNWWSSNSPTFSSLIVGATAPNEYLVLKGLPNPNKILNNGVSTVSVDLTHDQSGTYYDPVNGHVPDGIHVIFTSTLGTPINNNLPTLNGEVTYTYTAGNIPGNAVVTTTVDGASVNTPITIVREDVYVSPTGSDSNDGNQTNPFKTIAHGIANVNTGGTVHIASGTYYENNINIIYNMNIIGQNRDNTIINGMNEGTIFISGGGTQVNINNLTLTNGFTTANGGAILVRQSTWTVNNCTLTDNTAENGGAIYGQATLTINNCTLSGNSATNGGAIYNQLSLIINNGNFTDNTATDGGAIDNNGNMNLSNSNFTANNATNFGGAIYNDNVLTINNSSFTGNNATNNGGAIYNDMGLTVNNSTFIGNNATNGGAINNIGTLTLSSSTINNNNANNGGAIYNTGSNVKVNYNRIVGNTATNGSAIYNTGTMNATLNWWGSNNDPSGNVSGVIVTPYLVLTITANPTSIGNYGSSTITADLQHDSGGIIHPPTSGYVPDGIPVTFKTNLGTIISSSLLENGITRVNLNSGSTAGTATVHATVDGYSVNTPVIVRDTIRPTVSANHRGGIYNTKISVTLTMSKPGTIYYTTNGATPTFNSNRYLNPLTISTSTTLKYMEIANSNNLQSSIYTQKYTIEPKVTKTTPTKNAQEVPATLPITLKFTENIKPGTNYSKIYVKNVNTGKNITISKTIRGNTLIIKTSGRLENITYLVYIPTDAVKDTAGNNLQATYSFKFRGT